MWKITHNAAWLSLLRIFTEGRSKAKILFAAGKISTIVLCRDLPSQVEQAANDSSKFQIGKADTDITDKFGWFSGQKSPSAKALTD